MSRIRRFNVPLIVFWSGMLVVAAISYPIGVPELVFLVVGAALSQALTWLRDRQLRDVRLRGWIPVVQAAMADQERWQSLYNQAHELSESGADSEARRVEARIVLSAIATRTVVAAAMLDGAAHVEYVDGAIRVTTDKKYLNVE